MPRYTIVESVGNRVQRVNSFEDLEKHHPSSGREPGRNYATINGELEEVRYQGGRTYIKKDFVLQQDAPGPVSIPAPAAGYIHHLNDGTNAVRIYDKPFGTPGAVMLAQSLHMQRGSSPREGAYVEYGAPMGRMGDVGSPGSVHAHVEAEHGTFQRYIRDIANGTIRPGGVTNPLADGVLRNGESGTPVQQMQQQLKNLGYKDAQGRTLVPDGDFGSRTQQAVQAFQRAHDLNPTGIADRATLDTLRRAQTPQTPAPQPEPRPQPAPQPPAPQPQPPRAQTQWGPTPLSNLIGSGEGGYGSYNRGRAGDAGGRQIDFSEMSVGEIMRRQNLPRSNGESLFAVGKFQIIPNTMRETVQRMGIDRNARFTPELQERMFADYLVDEKRPSIKAYITGAGGAQALGRAQLALAQEFASVADPRTGRSYYDGDSAGNSASISPRQVQGALDTMRERYRANVAEGMLPAQAYAVIGGGTPSQPAPRPAPLADGVLRHGESGPEVQQLQQQLKNLGYKDAQGRTLVPDGDFGTRTQQAVQAFQRAHELSPSGVADRVTLSTLRRSQEAASERPDPQQSAPQQPRPPAPRGADLIRMGDDGADVREVQQRLAAHRVEDARGRPIVADGDFGPRTREAVLSFQRSRGLDVDGVVGPDTLGALRQPPPLRLGDHGECVVDVQRLLNRAGPDVPVTGTFNHLTEGAVKDYQKAHGLTVDGVVGPNTLEHLQRAGQQQRAESPRSDARPVLSDANHPDNALYAQTLAEVCKLDAQRGRTSDAASEHLAGALTVEAKRQGMSAVNHVVLSEDGSRAFAVQGAPDSVLKRMAYVETQHATRQTLTESTQIAAALPSAQPARVQGGHEQALQPDAQTLQNARTV